MFLEGLLSSEGTEVGVNLGEMGGGEERLARGESGKTVNQTYYM